MPALHQVEWTAAQAIALPGDGNRYEVLDGELFVTPAPTWGHQAVIGELFPRLKAYVSARGLGWAKLSPADIVFTERRLVQPDIFVVPARADRHRKRLIYQEQGVSEYWIVDPAARLVERWRPEDSRPEQIVDVMEWQPEPGMPPLRIDLVELFRAVASSASLAERAP